MKKRVFSIVKLILSAAMIPLCFIKFFCDTGHLPDVNGNVIEHKYYYSVLDNVSALGCPFLVYLTLAFLALSVVFSAIGAVRTGNRILSVTGNVIFIVASAMFLVVLVAASTVARGY